MEFETRRGGGAGELLNGTFELCTQVHFVNKALLQFLVTLFEHQDEGGLAA